MDWDFIMAGVGRGKKCPNAGWDFGKSEFPVGTCPEKGQNRKREVWLESCQHLKIKDEVKILVTVAEVN